MKPDLSLSNADVNDIASKTVRLIIMESGGDRAAQLSASLGTLMWITRHHGMPDAGVVNLLAEMYAANPRVLDA